MPIARIITSMPELSGGLVRDLNSRGFEVRVVSPEQEISGTADLEIRLEVSACEAAAVQMRTSSDAVQQQEDIWAMLAAFHSDELTQNAMPDQSALTTDEEPGVPRDGNFVNEQTPAAPETAQPVSEKIAESMFVDPELVPSMFNFAANGDATTEEIQFSQEKTQMQGGKFRDLVPARNGLRNFWSAKLVTATVCASVIILLVLSFARHRSVLPAAVSASDSQAQTHVPLLTSTPSATVVPVKSVAISKFTRRAVDRETDIAEDRVVHYRNKTKSRAVLPEENNGKIRTYSDMD